MRKLLFMSVSVPTIGRPVICAEWYPRSKYICHRQKFQEMTINDLVFSVFNRFFIRRKHMHFLHFC